MCGIAGWVNYDGDLGSHQDVITRMARTMARRGPDAGGVWIDRHVGFGHRRLAVIDLAGGVQPMQAEELGQTTVSLIYTGEVYNFVELRDQLEQLGHQFKTRSDTEVVLRDTCNGATRLRNVLTVCSPSRSGTSEPKNCS